jgi:hypothetical protein
MQPPEQHRVIRGLSRGALVGNGLGDSLGRMIGLRGRWSWGWNLSHSHLGGVLVWDSPRREGIRKPKEKIEVRVLVEARLRVKRSADGQEEVGAGDGGLQTSDKEPFANGIAFTNSSNGIFSPIEQDIVVQVQARLNNAGDWARWRAGEGAEALQRRTALGISTHLMGGSR